MRIKQKQNVSTLPVLGGIRADLVAKNNLAREVVVATSKLKQSDARVVKLSSSKRESVEVSWRGWGD